MIYNFIPSNIIIGETYSNYNIKSSAWESNAPMWLYHALGNIGINRFTIPRDPVLYDFVEHRFRIPEDVTLIDRVHIFKEPPSIVDYPKAIIQGEIKTHFVQKGLWIHVTDIEDGYALIKYKSLPAVYDEDLDQTFPLIPDDEPLKNALRIYLLMQILMTGYVHEVYNIKVNNPWVNPMFMFEEAKKKARNSVGRMDNIDRHKVNKIINTFIAPNLSTTFYINDINR